jgi:hypothetical protein
LWHGTWTLNVAAPAGDCLVDKLHAPTTWNNMTIGVDRSGQSIKFDFWAGYEKDGGYTPDVFVGTVNDAGQIAGTPASTGDVYNTWVFGRGCHDAGWTIQSGQLSGSLSRDAHTVSGTIVETFRAVDNGQAFTIRSEFLAVGPQ